MLDIIRQRGWTELIGLSLLSLFLYKVGIFLFLFLIPLQVLSVRRGLKEFLYGAGIVLFFIFIFGIIGTRKIENGTLRLSLVMLELAVPAALAGGLLLVNIDFEYLERKLFRILAVTGTVGIVSVLVIVAVLQNESYMMFMKDQLTLFINQFKDIFIGSTAYNEAMINEMLNPEKLFETAKEIILRNYLFVYFLLLAGNWRLGTNIGTRSVGRNGAPFAGFQLPDSFVWPLLISWAGVLADNFISLGFISYIAWNAGLIFLLLYGLQGYAIIRFLLSKSNASRGLRLFAGLGIVFLLFIPGLNLLVMVGIPGFGVSELWIKYRKEERKE